MMTQKMQRICIAGIAVCGLATFVQAGRAQEPVAPRPAQVSTAAAQVLTLDIRDADIRSVFKMLFDVYKKDYSIAPEVQGNATLRMSGQDFETAVHYLMRSSAVPLKAQQKNRIWVVQAEDSTAKSIRVRMGTATQVRMGAAKTVSSPDAPATLVQVPRRVSGVLVTLENARAILINGPESSPDAVTRVVQVGDQIPAGVAGQEPLMVSKIDADGIELTQTGGHQVWFRVPIASQPSNKPAQKY